MLDLLQVSEPKPLWLQELESPEVEFGGGTLVGLALALLVGWCVWLVCFQWRRTKVFLSYRVDADLELVTALHKRLTKLGMRVWWDRVCLKPGMDFEEGFADGLFSSAVFIPILSRNALQPFKSLTKESRQDNVMLE